MRGHSEAVDNVNNGHRNLKIEVVYIAVLVEDDTTGYVTMKTL